MANITIKDIARELGFSISTVSRALQNHPDISDETKRVVVAYAREHHYRPNQLASSLRTQKNTTIGVLLPELTDFFFSSILAGIEQQANMAGYNVLIARSKDDPDRERQCLQMLYNSRVAGVVACPGKRTTDFSPYTDILSAGVPLILVDRQSPLPCDQIISDDYHGAFLAVEYLIQTGCKHIRMFSSPYKTHVATERQRGFREALLHYGLPYSDDLIIDCADRASTIRQASLIIGEENGPDAIFCINDATAGAVVYAANMKHLRIPEDISICGFSNDIVTHRSYPMQTTVEQYGKRVGRKAWERLYERMEGDHRDDPPATIIMPTSLIVRETTR